LAAVAVSVAVFVVPDAKAAGPSSGCKAAVTPGGQISMFPAWGGSPSALRLACVFEHDTAANDVADAFTIHDFSNVLWHNGAARPVVVDAAGIAPGATSFTITDCTGLTGYVNHSIELVSPWDAGSSTLAFAFSPAFETSISAGCVVTTSVPDTAGAPAGTTVTIDNAPGPRAVNDATVIGTALTSPTANFTASDVGLSVTGPSIAVGTAIAGVGTTTTATLSAPAEANGTNLTLNFGATYVSTSHRAVIDGGHPANNKVSSTGAKFGPDDVGLRITGDGIANPAYILSVAGSTATLGPGTPVTVDAFPGHQLFIGDPSITAPTNETLNPSTQVLTGDMEVQVDPSFFAEPGVHSCSQNILEPVHLAGFWEDLAAAPPPVGQAGSMIGRIAVFGTFSFAWATVWQRPALTPGDPIADRHYDIVFAPGLLAPLTGTCPVTATSPPWTLSLGISANSQSQTFAPPGRPGTHQLRLVKDNGQAGSTTTAFLTSESPLGLYSGPNFNRLCIIPAGPPTAGLTCGTG
jgi:hypothetical protein